MHAVSPKQRIPDSLMLLQSLGVRLRAASNRIQSEEAKRLNTAQARLEAVSWERVLQRGYVFVRDEAGAIVDRAAGVRQGSVLSLHFSDGVRRVLVGPEPSPRKSTRKKSSVSQQGSLF